LCEAVAQLMVRKEGERQIAVAPLAETTLRLAQKMIKRTSPIGIEIALIDAQGAVFYVKPE